jgi:hypothetical protein
MTKVEIAKLAHEIRSTYIGISDGKPMVPWTEVPDSTKDYIISEVNYWVNNPNALASDSHTKWLKSKMDEGWSYSNEIDYVAKKHPRISAYETLPIKERAANEIFMRSILSLLPFYGG